MDEDDYIPQHDWVDPRDEALHKAKPDDLPPVSEALILYLRSNREWMNRTPDPSWDHNTIQRNIGANAVIEHMELLLEQQRAAPA